MKKALHVLGLLALLSIPLLSAEARTTPMFGELYYDGNVVGTVIPPASFPHEGRDNLYVVMAGAVEDQLPVIGVAPGDTNYHGGQWAVHFVDWNAGFTPRLLTSEAEVLMAMVSMEVAITRQSTLDFLCPVQPNG